MYYFELRRIVRKYMRKRSLPKRPSTYDEVRMPVLYTNNLFSSIFTRIPL